MSSRAIETFRLVYNFSSLALVLLGVVGNTLMFLVFRRPSLVKLSISAYFCFMAVFNSYVCLNWIRIFFREQYEFNLLDVSQLTCKLLITTTYCSRSISAWLLVVAGIDRYVAIVYSTRFSVIRKPTFQLVTILVITFYNIAYYFHMFFDQNLVNIVSANGTKNSTTIKMRCSSPSKQTQLLLDFSNTALLPFVLMTASSVATFVCVMQSRARLKFYAENTREEKRASRLPKTRDIKFGITMIALNVYFFVSTGPNPVYNLLVLYVQIDTDVQLVLEVISISLYYSFFALVFYAQLATNNLVKRQFRALFALSHHRHENNLITTPSSIIKD